MKLKELSNSNSDVLPHLTCISTSCHLSQVLHPASSHPAEFGNTEFGKSDIFYEKEDRQLENLSTLLLSECICILAGFSAVQCFRHAAEAGCTNSNQGCLKKPQPWASAFSAEALPLWLSSGSFDQQGPWVRWVYWVSCFMSVYQDLRGRRVSNKTTTNPSSGPEKQQAFECFFQLPWPENSLSFLPDSCCC